MFFALCYRRENAAGRGGWPGDPATRDDRVALDHALSHIDTDMTTYAQGLHLERSATQRSAAQRTPHPHPEKVSLTRPDRPPPLQQSKIADTTSP
ncbi:MULTISPECIES: hypothetical protein [Streptomyces]|nr:MULTISPECIES: hypothetical protein [Streptomyces]MYT10626.1 hypothetical protein [Streptomyces sp. SID5470]